MAETVDITTLGLKVETNASQATTDLAKLAEQAKKTASAGDDFVKSVEREAAILGKSRSDVIAYDAAHAGLTKTQLQQVQASLALMQAYDKTQKAQESSVVSIFKGVTAAELLTRAYDGVTGAIRDMVDMTATAQQSQARLAAVVKASGEAVGITTEHVNNMAESLAKTTQFTEVQLRSAATTIMTFGGVTATSFDRILKLSADMASTGRGDIETWAQVFSKVGSAPADAIGMSERALGKFNPALKIAIQNAVDFGDKNKAMALFLDEITKRVGGTAQESYRGLAAQIGGTKKAYEELMVAMGNKVFDAASSQPSKLEQALRKLKDFINEDDWFKKLIIALAGGNPFGESEKSNASQIADIQSQIAMYKKLIDMAEKSNSPAADYKYALGVLDAKLKQLESAATQAAAKVAKAATGDTSTAPAGSAGGGAPLITIVQQRQLNDEKLRIEQAYIAQVYSMRQAETQREIALLDFQKQAGLIDEDTYIKEVGAKRELMAKQEVDKLSAQIDFEQKLLSSANAEYARTLKSDDAQAPQQIVAALGKVEQEKAKLKTLTDQQAEAEKKVSDAVRGTGQAQTLYDQQRQALFTAINREEENYRIGLKNQTDELQLQLDLVGKEPDQIQKANFVHQIELGFLQKKLDLERKIADLQLQPAKNAQEIADRQKELDQLSQDTQTAISRGLQIIDQTTFAKWSNDLAGTMADAIVNGGKDAASRLRDAVVAAFKKPIQVYLQGIINAGINGLFGAAGSLLNGGGLGGAAGALTGGLNAAGSAGTIGSFLGSGGVLNGAGDLIAGSGSGLAGFASSTALAAGATDSLAAAIGAAVPVIGWVVAIGSVLYTLFGSKGGGPKGGGSFSGAFDTAGSFLNSTSVSGTDNGRFYTPSDQDSGIHDLVTQNALGYANIARGLGGSPLALQWALGYDTDPNGTAQNRVSGRVTDSSGNMLFNDVNRQVGRDSGALQGEVSLEAERSMLAALQNTQFDARINKIFAAVGDASTASQKDIEAAIAKAQDLATVIKGLDSFKNWKGLTPEAIEAMQQGGETLTQTFQRVTGALTTFDQNFEPASKKLSDAQTMVTQTFGTLGIAIPQSSEEFYNLVHGLDLSTDAGRTMLATLLQVAPAFQTVEQAAQAAHDSFVQIASSLSSSFGQGNAKSVLDAATQAWMNLTPANQNGWTIGSTESNIQNLINSNQLGAAYTYAQTLGGNAVDILNQMLSAYGAWQTSMNSNTSSVNNSTAAVSSLGNAATTAAQALKAQQDQLKTWALGKLTGSDSPMLIQQKLNILMGQYNDAVKNKDLGNFSSIADQLLQLAQQAYSPSGPQYLTLFSQIMSDAQKLGGFTLPNGSTSATATTTAVNNSTSILSQWLAKIKAATEKAASDSKVAADSNAKTTNKAISDAAEKISRDVSNAVKSTART